MAKGSRIARQTAMIGAGLVMAGALGAVPGAQADPPPGCIVVQGQPVPDCGLRAYEADIAAAGYRDARGNTVAVDQGLDMCGLMDRGLSQPEMVGQFLRDNPGLGPNGAAAVVRIATIDLCPWHR
jgi:hypothetical protein